MIDHELRKFGTRVRRVILALGLLAGFVPVSAKLVTLAARAPESIRLAVAESQPQHALARPDIVDRNGQMVATDIPVYWLHADPTLVINADDAAEQLASALPGLNAAEIRNRLSSRGHFVWIKRGLTPKEAATVHNLGLAGLTLTEEPQRVYPAGEAVAHIVGQTNVDNVGLSGVEKYIDDLEQLTPDRNAPSARNKIRLTLDLRLQYVLRGELLAAQERFQTKAAGGVLLDVENGEILAMASLPDFDPNRRDSALAKGRQNRLTADTYELGSVFKTFTIAMAIDAGLIRPEDEFDIRTPLAMRGLTLRDPHAHSQYATVEDILVHSSNTGAARIALHAGSTRQREFLKRIGLLDPLDTQLGRTASPLLPPIWRDINTVTIAYGHGLSVTPLAFTAAAAALVNGGYKVMPKFVLDGNNGDMGRKRVISAQTSAAMRQMLQKTVEKGTGRQARQPGYAIGGKTGTAIKLENGRYTERVVTSFMAAFPIEKPKYLLFVMLDEPKAVEGSNTEAAHNAVPSAGAVLQRIIPILGIAPQAPETIAVSSSR